jgi:hypothetical protein
MGRAVIGANQNARLKYRVPKDRTIKFDVRADHSVRTYVTNKKGLEEFDSGATRFRYYGGFQQPPKRHHHQELILPFDGEWYLMIVNPRKNPVQVEYEVFY